MKWLSALTIVFGSFLLFLVQPMVGNLLLPVFGGTAGVWIVCLCAFQTLLVVGYVYAHVLGELVGTGCWLRWVHVFLMLASSFVLYWSGHIVISLVAVAVLYASVGANAALVQRLVASDRHTYRLYALSNVGSFAGLLAFPFAVELLLPTSAQLKWYAGGVVAYSVLLAVLMAGSTGNRAARRASFGVLAGIGWREAMPWFCLSALSCFALDGLTSHLCQDVTPLPLLWCLLLAVYLLTWSLAFNDTGARIGRRLGALIFVCLVLQVLHAGNLTGTDYVFELCVGGLLLLSGCWYVHSHLYLRRPEVEKLTGYYFVIALGGAAGGIAATLIVPAAFDFVAEYPLAQIFLLGLLAYHGLAGVRSLRVVADNRSPAADFIRSSRMTWVVGTVVLLAAGVLWRASNRASGVVLAQERSFYGVSKVVECFPDGPRKAGLDGGKGLTLMALLNNSTVHGCQYANGTWRRYAPTLYYSEAAGGMAVLNHPAYRARRPMRVALLGMGVGTMAYYGRKGDVYRFFEIDPTVIKMATNPSYFTFLSRSNATIEISEGDARKQLEKEVRENAPLYDLIVVDVFSGDSVPPHLATVEAMALYANRLAPGGVIAMHVTNWHIDLVPIVKALAKSVRFQMRAVTSTSGDEKALSFWAYLSREPLVMEMQDGVQAEIDLSAVRDVRALTDDHHALMPFLSIRPQKRFHYLPTGE